MTAVDQPASFLISRPPRAASGLRLLLLLFVRIVVAVPLVLTGIRVLLGQQAAARDAAAWGIPSPSLLAWIGGVVLVLFGLVLLTGLACRLAALVLLLVALLVIATGGRVDGGLTLVAASLISVGCIVVVARGGGAAQLLDRVAPNTW